MSEDLDVDDVNLLNPVSTNLWPKEKNASINFISARKWLGRKAMEVDAIVIITVMALFIVIETKKKKRKSNTVIYNFFKGRPSKKSFIKETECQIQISIF